MGCCTIILFNVSCCKNISSEEGISCEKSHFCLVIALKELFVNEDELNAEMLENFELCMNLRHEADYGLTYHQESAETAIKYAEEFLNNALKLL